MQGLGYRGHGFRLKGLRLGAGNSWFKDISLVRRQVAGGFLKVFLAFFGCYKIQASSLVTVLNLRGFKGTPGMSLLPRPELFHLQNATSPTCAQQKKIKDVEGPLATTLKPTKLPAL